MFIHSNSRRFVTSTRDTEQERQGEKARVGVRSTCQIRSRHLGWLGSAAWNQWQKQRRKTGQVVQQRVVLAQASSFRTVKLLTPSRWPSFGADSGSCSYLG